MQNMVDFAEVPANAAQWSAKTAERIVHLKVLRGLAIISVVGVHAFGYASVQSEADRARVETI